MTAVYEHITARIWVNTIRITNGAWRQYSQIDKADACTVEGVQSPERRVAEREPAKDYIGAIYNLNQLGALVV